MAVRPRGNRNSKKAVRTEHAKNNAHFDGLATIRSAQRMSMFETYASHRLYCPHWHAKAIRCVAIWCRSVHAHVCFQLNRSRVTVDFVKTVIRTPPKRGKKKSGGAV